MGYRIADMGLLRG